MKLLYADDKIIDKLPIEWEQLMDTIRMAVSLIHLGDYSQPLKPYLRYNNPKNRIIAMPAFLGGEISMAGIKWIASFPDNISKGLQRAHCVIVLNEPNTGVPLAVFNSAQISALRTASVSGTFIEEFLKKRGKHLNLGIIGWGPIGKCHYRLINEKFLDFIDNIYIYDIREIKKIEDEPYQFISTTVLNSWQEVYKNSDIVITCTVSEFPYIDLKPQNETLLLNVSLRDYKPSIYSWVKNSIVVDDWEEVCRENTDIENMHKICGLSKEDTVDMYDILFESKINDIYPNPIMFNPMGLAAFDIAISSLYYKKLIEMNYGVKLD